MLSFNTEREHSELKQNAFEVIFTMAERIYLVNFYLLITAGVFGLALTRCRRRV